MARIGVVGTGYIAKGIVMALGHTDDLEVSRVFTHSDPSRRTDYPRPALLTNQVDDLVAESDLVVVASGDPIRVVGPVEAAIAAGGAREVFLEVRASDDVARHLYERHGFTAIGLRRNYYPRLGEDALVMRADLTAPDGTG